MRKEVTLRVVGKYGICLEGAGDSVQDPKTGEWTYSDLHLQDGEIFHPGNSIGGYRFFIGPNGREVRVVRVTRGGYYVTGKYNDVAFDHDEIPTAIMDGRIPKGTRQNGWEGYTYIRDGWKGLLACSSGSARRGIWHPIVKRTPLDEALHKFHFSERQIEHVTQETIAATIVYEGGPMCKHQTHGGYGQWVGSDYPKDFVVVEPQQYVKGHFNQYHNGCSEKAGAYRYPKATALVQFRASQNMSGGWGKSITRILVAPGYDPAWLLQTVQNNCQ